MLEIVNILASGSLEGRRLERQMAPTIARKISDPQYPFLNLYNQILEEFVN